MWVAWERIKRVREERKCIQLQFKMRMKQIKHRPKLDSQIKMNWNGTIKTFDILSHSFFSSSLVSIKSWWKSKCKQMKAQQSQQNSHNMWNASAIYSVSVTFAVLGRKKNITWFFSSTGFYMWKTKEKKNMWREGRSKHMNEMWHLFDVLVS